MTSLRPATTSPDRLRGWLRRLALQAQRILPARCLLCAEAGSEDLDLCAACRMALPDSGRACTRCALPLPASAQSEGCAVCGHCLQRPPPLCQVHSAFLYAAPLDRLVQRYKFHGDLAAGRLLARLMADAFADCERPHALVPVPLHRARLRRRGYDQALELARPLAARLDLPLRTDLLRRVRATAAQSRLDACARRRNLRGAFATRGHGAPAHVALVDDVMTTGATLHAAAVALRQAGVERVDAWICARAP